MQVTVDVPMNVLFWLAVIGGPLTYLIVGAIIAGVWDRIAGDRDFWLILLPLWPVVILLLPFYGLYRIVAGR